MKILSLSDTIVPTIYSPQVKQRFPDVDLVISCGDEPYYYLEFLVSSLNVPTYFVRGNHAPVMEYGDAGERSEPQGAIDLHRRVIRHKKFILAGVQGCLRYRPGPFQYTQAEMLGHILSIAPTLLFNRLKFGRYLDIFVSHSPPAGIHDDTDRPHQGIRAFRWLIDVFKPGYYFHGHMHVYHPGTETETLVGATWVLNTFGFRLTNIRISD